ncbi:membrane protein [Bacillus phage Nachito]|nr:membrane protein [Bacillus phage Nachito]
MHKIASFLLDIIVSIAVIGFLVFLAARTTADIRKGQSSLTWFSLLFVQSVLFCSLAIGSIMLVVYIVNFISAFS